ncbi:MAG: BsuBI/PstI family type II restriction endonuclease [Anaerolineales bacterium]
MSNQEKIEQALSILTALGMPREQQNNRTAMCLLALVNIHDEIAWRDAQSQLMGIRGILDFIRNNLNVPYAENTRETIRDESIKPMVAAGFLMLNPDKPDRSTNSPATVYQVTGEALTLIKNFGTNEWEPALSAYMSDRVTLVELYARRREIPRTTINLRDRGEIKISPGEHSALIKQILEDFCPRFAVGGITIYVGDTGEKWGFVNRERLEELHIQINAHGQMPDVVLFLPDKNWILLIESVTSNGPIDARRHEELLRLFSGCIAGLVFITAFPDRNTMRKYLSVLAWETEVWIADAPDHLIHFNGDKFLGPHN